MSETFLPAKKGQYYQHQDGGLYRFYCITKSAEDLKESVTYEHIWPFTPEFWSRKKEEFFDGRFKPISATTARKLKSKPQLDFQKEITENKRLRRIREGK